jgi:hypothetical protein
VPTAEVFDLSPITDSPIFEGFAFATPPYDAPSLLGRESLDDDLCPGYESSETVREWHVPTLKAKWKPPRVLGRVAPFNDYPCVDSYPAFSRRACSALRDLLKPNGEALPLASDRGEYYFFNVTTVVDVLNVTKSKCNFWPSRPMTAQSIDWFEFHADKLDGLSIFRIVDWPMPVLVTREFVDRVSDAGLNGFRFRQVWPLPQGANWRMQDRDSPARREAHALSQHTLVLILPLAGRKPSRAEKKRIDELADELDAQLVLKFHNARYFGSLEGTDAVGQECRFFLSCPDVDALVIKLKPWLASMAWPRTAHLMKRYGDMHSPHAKEVVIELPS